MESATPELEVDILRYFIALLDNWKWILGGALICGSIFFGYSQTLPNTYEGFIRVAIVNAEDPGGVQPDERRASEVLTLVEHGFIMGVSRDNYQDVMRAKLRSRLFTVEFMESHSIYPSLYPEQWDASEQKWVDGFVLNKAEAIKWFGERIRVIEHNPETDILTIRMRWTDPVLARDWANQYVAAFNDHIRADVLTEVARKQAFLRDELRRSDIVETEKSIYRMIEAQTAIAMLANSRDEYALEVIDPAIMPFDRITPAPKRMAIFGTVSGGMLVCFFLIGRVLVEGFLLLISQLKARPMVEGV